VYHLKHLARRVRFRNFRASPACRYSSSMDTEFLTPAEVASILKLSKSSVIRIFERIPGVLVIGRGESRFKRKYRTLRIPRMALERFIIAHRVG
jgi:hypothetical protein